MMAGPWGDPKDSAPSSCLFIFHAVEVVVNRRSSKKGFLKNFANFAGKRNKVVNKFNQFIS